MSSYWGVCYARAKTPKNEGSTQHRQGQDQFIRHARASWVSGNAQRFPEVQHPDSLANKFQFSFPYVQLVIVYSYGLRILWISRVVPRWPKEPKPNGWYDKMLEYFGATHQDSGLILTTSNDFIAKNKMYRRCDCVKKDSQKHKTILPCIDAEIQGQWVVRGQTKIKQKH